jgi:hypothetical protein
LTTFCVAHLRQKEQRSESGTPLGQMDGRVIYAALVHSRVTNKLVYISTFSSRPRQSRKFHSPHAAQPHLQHATSGGMPKINFAVLLSQHFIKSAFSFTAILFKMFYCKWLISICNCGRKMLSELIRNLYSKCKAGLEEAREGVRYSTSAFCWVLVLTI